MKRIYLNPPRSFFEDLSFSHWLQQDRLLAIVMDMKNRVHELRLDARHYAGIVAELHAKRYIFGKRKSQSID